MAPPTQSGDMIATKATSSHSRVEDNDVAMDNFDTPSTQSNARDKGPTKPRRIKKATYLARKEEKRISLHELDILQAQLKQLKRQAATDPAKTKQEHTNMQRELAEELVAGASQPHQLSVVNLQSALPGYVSAQQNVPFEMWIYLGTDTDERKKTLLALKTRKVRASQLYIAERTRFLDPVSPFAEHSRFVAHNGDYCALRFDITPYEGISNVKIVEDDASASDGISQNRLVSSLTNGVEMEMNNVMYTEFREHDDESGDGGAFGLFTADFVDKDELFPYVPKERVRYDVTAVLTVKAHEREQLNAVGELVNEQIVVLTRSCLIKLHHGEIPLTFETAHEMRESAGKWGDVMLQSVRQLVYR
ncbi:hypothetical protein GN244_ATG20577 [Phytophthora infestans]|uniref:Uncharacterized protein n=1 Tax=Phytophthora infestans TaxID=4787 RepID=A0A833W410_PHYIN|nr:hypothetical protein GN244_ATG20577 [Phytophthora infestans]KAF4131131.1 hypothetical protein GN958_ATG19676 [Phytophthora infestans]